MTLARFPISATQIDETVAMFYARIRLHPQLGAVFASHVQDWPAHEAKIASFWRNAILFERCYDGNPMQVHQAAGNVRPGMFDAWLAQFDATLTETLPEDTAQQWSALAHRIGRGLRMGVANRGIADGPPILR